MLRFETGLEGFASVRKSIVSGRIGSRVSIGVSGFSRRRIRSDDRSEPG
jgi:hypothetical protein